MIFSENGFRSIVPRTKELNSLKIYANFHQNRSRREGKTGVVSIISEQLSYTLNFTCLHINFTSQKWIIIDVELELVFLSNSPAPWQSIHHLLGLGLWWLSHSVSVFLGTRYLCRYTGVGNLSGAPQHTMLYRIHI